MDVHLERTCAGERKSNRQQGCEVSDNELGYCVARPEGVDREEDVQGLFQSADEVDVIEEDFERVAEAPRQMAVEPALAAGNLRIPRLRARELL
eukprot:jgi/Botrbrau1/6385/Bobra.49_1s0003.1